MELCLFSHENQESVYLVCLDITKLVDEDPSLQISSEPPNFT